MIRITVFQDGESMGTGAYDVERILLGSAEDVDLRVQEPGVLPEHAEVFVSGGKVYVRKLGEAPIWVSGEEVERSELTAEHRFKIGGPIEFAVKFGRASPQTMAVKRAGAISFGSVKTYDEKELDEKEVEEAPSNEPMDLSNPTTTAQAAAAKAQAKKSVSERAIEQQQADRRRAVATTVALAVGMLVIIAVIWFGIVPTIQKYFFYEDDPIPGSR